MIRPWAVIGPVFLVVTGCAQFDRQDSEPKEVQTSVEPDAAVAIDLAEPDAVEQARVVLEPPPLPRRKPVLEPTPEPERVEEADPDMLIGLDFTVTRALLGEPAQQTEQSPAKIWTYKGEECMLNVFFYPSVEGGAFRLLTYEAESGETAVEEAAEATDAAPTPPAAASAPATADAQTSEEQSQDEVSAFTATCFTALLREAEQQRETERLKQAQRSSDSGQSLDKEPPQAE